MTTLKAVVIILDAPAVLIVNFVTATSFTAFEKKGALKVVAPILAIRDLLITSMMAPSTSKHGARFRKPHHSSRINKYLYGKLMSLSCNTTVYVVQLLQI